MNLPIRTKGSKPKTKSARVLTSDECIAILREKEDKKKREADEKQKRMEERLLKRKQREEEQKRKQEEKVRKAEERALKQEEKACQAAEKKAQKRAKTGKHGKDFESNSKIARFSRKKAKLHVDTIQTDLCCVCYGSYAEDEGTDRDWLECSCGTWLHEDCILPDSNNTKLCPLC